MDPQALVTDFNEAINRRDLDRMVALMSADHVFIDSAGSEVKGRAQMEKNWAGFFEQFPDYRNVFEQTYVRGGSVFVVGRSECSFAPLAGPALWRAEVEDGRVRLWQVLEDTPQNRASFHESRARGAQLSRDDLYSLPLDRVGDFQFDEAVVQVFPDMIARSVPGYGSILSMIGELAAGYAQPGSNVYDLGCSLGACSKVIRERAPADCRIWAVDSSPAMVEALRRDLGERSTPGCEVVVVLGDIRETPMESASLSVLNFTLQFLPLKERAPLIERIARATLPGGALVLSEKILYQDPTNDRLLTDLHHTFKRAQGYSELEIAQKRTALEKTLLRETLGTHLERLKGAGFSNAITWFQCFNFVSILAVK